MFSVFFNHRLAVATSCFFKNVIIFQNLLDMMIAEEEGLKKRLLSSIESCRKELGSLCDELQLPPFEVVSVMTRVLCARSSSPYVSGMFCCLPLMCGCVSGG